jgi:hypothetical protein
VFVLVKWVGSKDFYLKTVYDEKIPLRYWHNRREYVLTLERLMKEALYLRPDKPVEWSRPQKKMDLMFDYQGRFVCFSVRVNSVEDNTIIAEAPEALCKNLGRSYSRVGLPRDLEVRLNFLGDRYALKYPRVSEYAAEDSAEFTQRVNAKNFPALMKQLDTWIKQNASGYKVVLFKGVKPNAIEERILAETGKVLFIPSTRSKLPRSDPYPQKRLITEEMFLRYLESIGVAEAELAETLEGFIKEKFEGGILSEIWAPIRFQQYVIGYVHAWIRGGDRGLFNLSTVSTLFQCTRVFAVSLQQNGYFESGKIRNNFIDGKIFDISVSGLRFAYPVSLKPDSELTVKLRAPSRTVQVNARIVRQYTDGSMGYFGCRFLDMAPEDVRFLFEYIYGTPLTDKDAVFLAGEV